MKKLFSSIVFSFTLFACGGDKNEVCNNQQDDNGDGAVDCDDLLCAEDPLCEVGPEVCNDNVDNDRDGGLDCADSDCDAEAICIETGNCADGTDNDVDNFTDCADPDCAADPLCVEVCDDGQDNDQDTFADCVDADCAGDPACQNIPEVCTNGADDDGDTRLDCFDADCAADPACALGSENCTDGQDNDADGLVDCIDPNCGQSPDCTAAAVGFDALLQNIQNGAPAALGDSPEFFGANCPNGNACAGNTPQCGSCDGGVTFTCFADVDPATLSCCESASGTALGGTCSDGNQCGACGETSDTAACIPPGRDGFCDGTDLVTCPEGEELVVCETRRSCVPAADIAAGLACGVCGDEIIITSAANAEGGLGCCAFSDGTVNGDIFCSDAQTCFTCDDATFSCIDPAIGFCQ
jgi:hypothetical protein